MNKNVRYSQKKVLNQREYELLLRGVRGVDYDLFKFESQSIAFPSSRVGLSLCEITHIHEDWLDWQRYCKLGQFLDARQKSVQLLTPEVGRFAQGADL